MNWFKYVDVRECVQGVYIGPMYTRNRVWKYVKELKEILYICLRKQLVCSVSVQALCTGNTCSRFMLQSSCRGLCSRFMFMVYARVFP